MLIEKFGENHYKTNELLSFFNTVYRIWYNTISFRLNKNGNC